MPAVGEGVARSIHGVKWLDRDANSERDADEPGLPGVTIYSDLNGNRQLDPGEPHTLSMQDDPVTDFDEVGLYWLDVRPGAHLVREVVPDGFAQSFPTGGAAHEVRIEPGDVVEGIERRPL